MTCTNVDDVRIVCRFSSIKGVLVVVKVLRVYLAVCSESVFFYSRSR